MASTHVRLPERGRELLEEKKPFETMSNGEVITLALEAWDPRQAVEA